VPPDLPPPPEYETRQKRLASDKRSSFFRVFIEEGKRFITMTPVVVRNANEVDLKSGKGKILLLVNFRKLKMEKDLNLGFSTILLFILICGDPLELTTFSRMTLGRITNTQ
jgi:hypothetical protein